MTSRAPAVQDRESKADPVYQAAPPTRRWRGRLDALWGHLGSWARKGAVAAEEVVRGRGWEWVVLRGGALVAMRVRTDLKGRLELRIARKTPPATPEGWGKWENELVTFLKHFGLRPLDGRTPCRNPISDWWCVPGGDGEASAHYLELRAGEIRPGRTLCAACLERTGEVVEVDWWPHADAGGQRCMDCARAEGRRDPRRRDP